MSQLSIAVLMPDDPVRASFFPSHVVKALCELGEVHWNPSSEHLGGEALATFLRDRDVAVTGWGCPLLDAQALSQANRLRLLMHTGGAVSAYASPALYDRGIRVISGNDCYAESVAEGTLAYILTGLRQIPLYAQRVQRGDWSDVTDDTESLLDQTVGLVGLGAIARKLVPMLQLFHPRIMAYDPFVEAGVFTGLGLEQVDRLETLFQQCRVISLHLPRTQRTHHIIGRDLLWQMPQGALLVNTARGSVLDEEALAEALVAGRIRAVLDVFEAEPLPATSRLRGLDNAVLIPHMAGPTKDRRAHTTYTLMADVRRFFAGESLQCEISRAYGLSMTNDYLVLKG